MNISFKKMFLVFFSVLVFFQLITFLVLKYCNHTINPKYFLGLCGTNIWPVVLGLLILIGLYIYLKKIGLNLNILFAIILAAVMSNLIERFVYGGAVDYISFFEVNVFNLADFVIIVSMIAILIYGIILKKI